MTDVVMWLVQCGVVAAVMTLGAWVWERGARWSGRPARWAWLSALVGSVALPFVLRLVPQEAWTQAVPPVGIMRIDALSVSTTAAANAPWINATELAVALWVLLSVLVIGYAATLLIRLGRARRRWREAEVDGAAVLVSRNVGPAAVGLRHGRVVIPSWALELDRELRGLMLLHEREHVRAGDPRLLLGALTLLAVMPWNPLVWLQLIRLRNAIELDCDARVLRHGLNPTRYGSLLLEIGRRRGGSPLMLATFAEPRLLLEERIRRIAQWPVRRRPVRAALLSVLALALFSTALLARVRVEAVGSALKGDSGVLEAFGLPGVQLEFAESVPLTTDLTRTTLPSDTPPPTPALRPDPRQTPYTTAPQLLNADVVMRRMAESYPAQLREAGVNVNTSVWLLVNEQGEVLKLQLAKASGYPPVDAAALKLAATMQFQPARFGERAVPAWIEVPLAFGQLAHSVSVNEQPTTAQPKVVPEGPTFTPMTVRPELLNARVVERALIEAYPPVMRDAGIGGTAVVWFFIDDTGRVLKTQLSKGSGYAALDQAAMQVAGAMQFSPAKNRDKATQVWVEIPIHFTAKEPDEKTAALRQTYSAIGAMGFEKEVPVTWSKDTAAILSKVRAAGLDEPTGVRASTTARATPSEQPPTVALRRPSLSSPPVNEEEIRAAPTFTPMTEKPALKNNVDAERALIRHYPPLLRDAGIGGTTVVWLFINEQGQVMKTQVSKSSGYEALDRAALRVVAEMEFTPAKNRDKAVAVWIEMPIVFSAM